MIDSGVYLAEQRVERSAHGKKRLAKTVDISDAGLIVEVTGTSDKLDAFENMLSDYGIVEMIRSGNVAIARGSEPT